MSPLAKAHKNLFLSLRDKVGCLGLSKAWDRKGSEFLRGIKASDIWGQLFTQILTQTAVLCLSLLAFSTLDTVHKKKMFR